MSVHLVGGGWSDTDVPRAVVLVEGESDRIALVTLAARTGRDPLAGVLAHLKPA